MKTGHRGSLSTTALVVAIGVGSGVSSVASGVVLYPTATENFSTLTGDSGLDARGNTMVRQDNRPDGDTALNNFGFSSSSFANSTPTNGADAPLGEMGGTLYANTGTNGTSGAAGDYGYYGVKVAGGTFATGSFDNAAFVAAAPNDVLLQASGKAVGTGGADTNGVRMYVGFFDSGNSGAGSSPADFVGVRVNARSNGFGSLQAQLSNNAGISGSAGGLNAIVPFTFTYFRGQDSNGDGTVAGAEPTDGATLRVNWNGNIGSLVQTQANLLTYDSVNAFGIYNSNNGTSGTMYIDDLTVSVVPEPASAALLAAAGGLAMLRRRRTT